jgi:hypothetical protein
MTSRPLWCVDVNRSGNEAVGSVVLAAEVVAAVGLEREANAAELRHRSLTSLARVSPEGSGGADGGLFAVVMVCLLCF